MKHPCWECIAISFVLGAAVGFLFGDISVSKGHSSVSEYQSALSDDRKRVDKHIYDLGYYDGWEAANKSEKQIRVDNGGHAIIDIDKMIAKEPCGKLKEKN